MAEVSLSRRSLPQRKQQHPEEIGRQNAFAPGVSRLPVETLTEIFLCFKRDHVYGDECPLRSLTIAHVCRFWRHVALATPMLWDQIVVSCRPSCVREFLHRSEPVLVDITSGETDYHGLKPDENENNTDYPNGVTAESATIALRALYRTRCIRLMIGADTFSSLVKSGLFDVPAPNLDTLQVTTDHGSLPADLAVFHLRHALPCLSDVILNVDAFSWVTSTLYTSTHMRKLHLMCMAVLPKWNPFTIPEALAVLEAMPLLEHLEFHHCIPTVPSVLDAVTLPSPSRVVVLSYLGYLRLESEHTVNCINFLLHIACPSTAAIILQSDLDDITDYPHCMEAVTPHILSRLSGSNVLGPTQPPRSLFLGTSASYNTEETLCLVLWQSDNPITPMMTDGVFHVDHFVPGEPVFALFFDNISIGSGGWGHPITSQSMRDRLAAVLMLCKKYPLDDIRSVSLGREPINKGLDPLLVELMEMMPNTTSLAFSDWSLDRIGEFLTFRRSGEQSRVFPKLERLKLYGAHDRRFIPLDVVRPLAYALNRRRDVGATIQHLHLATSEDEPAYMERVTFDHLRPYVCQMEGCTVVSVADLDDLAMDSNSDDSDTDESES